MYNWNLLGIVNRWRDPSDMEGLRFIADCADCLTADPGQFGALLQEAATGLSPTVSRGITVFKLTGFMRL